MGKGEVSNFGSWQEKCNIVLPHISQHPDKLFPLHKLSVFQTRLLRQIFWCKKCKFFRQEYDTSNQFCKFSIAQLSVFERGLLRQIFCNCFHCTNGQFFQTRLFRQIFCKISISSIELYFDSNLQ